MCVFFNPLLYAPVTVCMCIGVGQARPAILHTMNCPTSKSYRPVGWCAETRLEQRLVRNTHTHTHTHTYTVQTFRRLEGKTFANPKGNASNEKPKKGRTLNRSRKNSPPKKWGSLVGKVFDIELITRKVKIVEQADESGVVKRRKKCIRLLLLEKKGFWKRLLQCNWLCWWVFLFALHFITLVRKLAFLTLFFRNSWAVFGEFVAFAVLFGGR